MPFERPVLRQAVGVLRHTRSLPFDKLSDRLPKGLLSGRLDEKVASTSSVAACRSALHH
jgi:hypothetical protein